ncbi:PucR family transcriptional regulator [Moorella sp. Hama-1]|uniref:PucR family transcriptional regulator n=1 Tax=Moorella sp. Hama-1 TaxID=2138101 RepID=UPI000D64BE5B|nr:PucR family transcriptional regulator [Moorella sp. Hama-1]BCV21319.1 PucR family transcriptional regulator [Moorella sp. Hama-1]
MLNIDYNSEGFYLGVVAMPLSVSQALQIGPLRRARVVAGAHNLEREITFVNIMEVPEVTRWMKGGELLLTAGFALKDNPELRKRIIYDLVGKGVTAFAIKPGQYLQDIPTDMIEHANQAGLPLLELPSDVPYMDIMLPIFELLINEQLYRRQRSQEIHDLLINVILGGSGLPGVCKALAQFTTNPVFIFSCGTCLGAGYPPLKNGQLLPARGEILAGIFQEIPEEIRSLSPHRAAHLQLSPELPACVIVPVATQETIDGYLVISESNRPLNDIEIRGIETGAAIVALEFTKQRAVAETEIRLGSELLDELLQGKIDNTENIIKRAAHLGINVTGQLVVFIIGFAIDNRTTGYHIDVHSEIIHLLRARFGQRPGGILLQSKGDQVIGLLRYCVGKGQEVPGILQEILATTTSRYPKARLRVGIGRAYEGLTQIKTSYEEALLALKVAWQATSPEPVSFAELGPLRILFSVKDLPQAKDFCREYIGRLRDYDSQNKTDLVATLFCYLNNEGNLRKTAQDLFVHKNSVIYRVKKIEEITGLTLNSAEDRFLLMLAAKLSQLTS